MCFVFNYCDKCLCIFCQKVLFVSYVIFCVKKKKKIKSRGEIGVGLVFDFMIDL